MKLLKTANESNAFAIQNENAEKGILIVDDSKFSRNILKDILKNEGLNIIGEARNGIEAIEMTKQKKPQYIFMDVEMPLLDGLGAIPKILEVDPDVHIIMCTAMGQKNIIVEAARAGAKDYVLKPYKKENIIRVLKEFMGAQQKDGQVIPFKGARKQKEVKEEVQEVIQEEVQEVEVEEKVLQENLKKEVQGVIEEEMFIEPLELEEAGEIGEEVLEPLDLEETEAILEEVLEPLDLEETGEKSEEVLEPLDLEEAGEISEEVLKPLDLEEIGDIGEGEKQEAPIIESETSKKANEEILGKLDIEDKEEKEYNEPYLLALNSEDEIPMEDNQDSEVDIQDEEAEILKELESLAELEQESSQEVLTEEIVLEATYHEEGFEATIDEEELQSLEDDTYEVLDKERKTEVVNQEQRIEIIEEITNDIEEDSQEVLENVKEQKEKEPESINQEERSETMEKEEGRKSILEEDDTKASSENRNYAYLWENRFGLIQGSILTHTPAKHKVFFCDVAYYTSDGYGLKERTGSDKEIMTKMIKAYLSFGNRLQQEEVSFETKRSTSSVGTRIFTNEILAEDGKVRTDITMADILESNDKNKKNSTQIFIRKTTLSHAMLQLVQGKGKRILGF